eukprot:356064-Chlamydomonas_euryale.AAC.7
MGSACEQQLHLILTHATHPQGTSRIRHPDQMCLWLCRNPMPTPIYCRMVASLPELQVLHLSWEALVTQQARFMLGWCNEGKTPCQGALQPP